MKKFLFTCLFLISGLAVAEHHMQQIMVMDPWIRELPPNVTNTGGFASIMNKTDQDVRLIKAESTLAGRVELHEHQMVDGLMKMREVAGGILIPANGVTELKPGSYHVMFIGVNEHPMAGNVYPIKLTFDNGMTMTVDFPVKSAAAMGNMQQGGHQGHGDHQGMKH